MKNSRLIFSFFFSAVLCFAVATETVAGADFKQKFEDVRGRCFHFVKSKPLPDTPNFAFGDLMQTVIYARHLIKQGAKEVVVDVFGHTISFFDNHSKINVHTRNGVAYEKVEIADYYNAFGCVKEFESDEELFYTERTRVDKWKDYILEKTDGGREKPVAIFWNCAKNHNPERNLSPGLESLVRPLPGVKFFDIEYKTDKKLPGVATPSKEDETFDNFDNLLSFLRALVELDGDVIASESGGFHFAAQAVRGAKGCDGCIKVLLPENENERYHEGKYGNTSDRCGWYKKQATLIRRKDHKAWYEVFGIKGKNPWAKTMEFVRDVLVRDAEIRAKKMAQQNAEGEKENKPKNLKEELSR